LDDHEATHEFRNFPSTTQARTFQALGKDSGQFLLHVHNPRRRAVFEDVRVTMGKDQNVAGLKNDALAIH
jgi:hypothetical protein